MVAGLILAAALAGTPAQKTEPVQKVTATQKSDAVQKGRAVRRRGVFRWRIRRNCAGGQCGAH